MNKAKIYSSGLGFANIDADLETTSIKISLAKSGAHSKSYLANIGKFVAATSVGIEADRPSLMRGLPPNLQNDIEVRLPQMDGAVIEMTDSQMSLDPS